MLMADILRSLADQQQFGLLRDNALRLLQEAGEASAWPLLSIAHAQLGERLEAVQAIQQAEAHLGDLDNDARVDLAGAYALTWRVEDAVALLQLVLEEQPEHALAMARLAWCRMQQGQLESARALYERSAELAAHRLPVWLALARLCLLAEDTTAAQTSLDAGIAQLQALHTEMPEAVVTLFTAQLRGVQLEVWLAADQMAQAEAWLEEQQLLLPENEWVGLATGFSALLGGHDRQAQADEALGKALTHYPENLDLLSQRAEVAQALGRSMQEVQLLRRLIRLAKSQDQSPVKYWVRLSRACLHNMTAQARHAAAQAMSLVDEMVVSEETPEAMIKAMRQQAKNAMAQVESQEQHFAQAQSLFDDVLAENPCFVPALQGLGQQHMLLGKIDEAVALFERIKEIDPAQGYSSLINARQFPDDEATLMRMERAAHTPSMEGSARTGLLFQLASAWEKRQDYDKAFALADEANAISRKQLHYDAKEHRQKCARVRHAFAQAFFDHRKDCGYRGEDESLPVFVLGMPRSGTTLVEQIIAGHSQIFGAGELGVIPSRIQGLNRWERHVGSGREYPDCMDDLNPYTTYGIADGILKELKELAAEAKPEAKFIVDKLPHNFENVGLIKFLFPQAKIISVRRDPRDIAMSNFFTNYQAKHGGMGFAYDMAWIGEQLADHNLLMHHWAQLFPGEILEVKYEDVLEDTEGQARRMLDYIGVDWEAQVLNHQDLERPVKTASVWQVRQPIYKTSKAKWMRYQDHLAPLIQGTNAKIEWDAIDMVTLPTAGMLTDGVALYKEDKLDEAEYEFKKLLHHLPEHAAANAMLGIIYARKGHLPEAIGLMKKAHEKCPWNKHWRDDLIQAYEMVGDTDKAEALRAKFKRQAQTGDADDGQARDGQAHDAHDMDWLLNTDSALVTAGAGGEHAPNV